MYYTIAYFTIQTQLLIWTVNHQKNCLTTILRRESQNFKGIDTVMNCQSYENKNASKLNSNIKESELIRSNQLKLNFSLRTLEFINFIENNLGSKISSKALESENLEELLKIKKDVQMKILQSTKNR
jgi:hypothetical protein